MSVVFELEAPYRGKYQLHRLSFGSGSPTVSIVAGLHGNELNAVHAVNMLAGALRAQRPRGTVHLFPLVNTFGADAAVKRWPFDDQDINLSFPGDPQGTSVERLAYALLQFSQADVCIDVHSGAPHVRELPQARTLLGGRELELARATALPVIWRRPGARLGEKGLVGAWRSAGAVAFRLVGGRGITLDSSHATALAQGLTNLLAHLGVVPSAPSGKIVADITQTELESHRASCGGFFVPEVRVGDLVGGGHLLGTIHAPIGGDPIYQVRAARPGVVMTARAYPLVHAQELLIRVAGTG